MRVSLWLCVCCLWGCKEEPPPLSWLAADWYGYLQMDEEPWLADASFMLDEEETLQGEMEVEEPDETRTYRLMEANEVEIGLSLSFIQVGGVRELYLDALAPYDPFYGAFRSRWFCEEESDGYCNLDGLFRLDPRPDPEEAPEKKP